jgi:HD superfamily phosphohydrolase
MIKHLISKNEIKLDDDVKTHNYMLELICALITENKDAWTRLLEPCEWFLTEIVSNNFCKIDVDKCDYLLRDHYYVGLEIEPFIGFLDRAMIVFDENLYSHIGYNADDFHLIENMFINRAKYHFGVYKLPEVAGIEKQLKDICLLAERAGFTMMGLRISEIQQDCEAYNKLDDSILDLIRDEATIQNDAMLKAKELIRQLDNDHFYVSVFETKDKDEANETYEQLKRKFGDVFARVKKVIPKAQVPDNIPLYDNGGFLVKKLSEHNLEYESTIIFSTAFDDVTTKNISNYLSINNNNNNNDEA